MAPRTTTGSALTTFPRKSNQRGLGQVVPNPITSVMKHFPEELEKYFPRGR